MNETIDAEGAGEVTGAPTNTQNSENIQAPESPKEESPSPQISPTPSEAPEIVEGQWFFKEGVLGSGDRPDWLLEKYGYNQENQAKAYRELEQKFGEQGKQLGAFTGAPDKYDFSALEDDKFSFDTQNETFTEFINVCQEGNANQEFTNKIAAVARKILEQPHIEADQEAQNYGAAYKTDRANIVNWVKNNNSEADSVELLDSVYSAGGMRALRNCMNTNGFHIPTGNQVPHVPQETLKDVKQDFADNIYGGDNLADNPEKAKKWIEKFNKIAT